MTRALLDEAPKPTGVGPDGTMPSDDPMNEEAVSAEEQAQYDQFVTKAMSFIHGKKTRDIIIDHMNQPDLPVPEAVGRTLAFVAQRVIELAAAKKVEISPDVAFHAGEELVSELMEVGAKAKVLPIGWNDDGELPPKTQELMEQAFSVAVHTFGKGIQDKEQYKQEAGDFFARGVAQEADEGRLDPAFKGPDKKVVAEETAVPEE